MNTGIQVSVKTVEEARAELTNVRPDLVDRYKIRSPHNGVCLYTKGGTKHYL